MSIAGNPYPFSDLRYTSDNKYFYYNSGSITASSPTGGETKIFSFTTGNFNHIGNLQLFCQDDGVCLLRMFNGSTTSDPIFLTVEYNTGDGANSTPIPLILPPLTQLSGFVTVSASPNTQVQAIYNGKTGGTIRIQDQELITKNSSWAKQ